MFVLFVLYERKQFIILYSFEFIHFEFDVFSKCQRKRIYVNVQFVNYVIQQFFGYSMRKYNNELAENVSTLYPKRTEANYAWGNAIGGMLMTPKLRGLWPGSTVDNNGNCYDVSGQGRTLSAGVLPTYAGASLYPYADFTRASGMYLNRNTEAGLEITSSIVVWTWVFFDAESTGVETPLVCKWGTDGNRSWILRKMADDTFNFCLTNDGGSGCFIDDGGEFYEESKWIFVLGKYAPLTEVSLFVGIAKTGVCKWYKKSTGVIASIFNSSAPLQVGGSSANGLFLDGKLSLWGLANYA